MESPGTRCGCMWLTARAGLRSLVDVYRVESVCAFHISQRGSVRLDEVCCIHSVSVTGETA